MSIWIVQQSECGKRAQFDVSVVAETLSREKCTVSHGRWLFVVESGRVGKLYLNNIVVCSGMVVGCYVAYGTNGCATKCEKRKLHDMHTYFYFYSGCI